MPFDWLAPNVPADIVARGPASRRAAAAQEVRERAGLHLRLGASQAYATHRCLGDSAWGHELCGDPALSDAEIRAVVGEVYAGGSRKRDLGEKLGRM